MIHLTLHFINGDRRDFDFKSPDFARGYLWALSEYQLITNDELLRALHEMDL